MTEERKHAPPMLYLLFTLVLFQTLGDSGGGSWLLADPSGQRTGFSISLLDHTPFHNFLIPGLFLFLALGVFPLGLLYPLLKRPRWAWANALNCYRDKHWAWTYSLYLGITLILWIDVQILFVGYIHVLQTIFAFVGVSIIVLSLLPSVQRWYTMDSDSN